MKKLPFSICLERKYTDINIEDFLFDWKETEADRRERKMIIDDKLHIELGKFGTYDITREEVMDIALRYALSKREFRTMMAELIGYKNVLL